MNKAKNKRGQMKIQQMAFMLIAVTLFLVMAGLFILVIRFSSLRGTAELLEERNALLLASKVADSAEFSCGNAFGKPRSNCIDMDKVMALTGRLDNYSNFWGIDGLEIRKIYPEEETITIIEAGSGTGVSNFVSLCKKEKDEQANIYDKCELGKIIVTYGEND